MTEFSFPKLQYTGPWVTFPQAYRIAELADEHDEVQIVSLDATYLRIVWADGEANLNSAGEEVE